MWCDDCSDLKGSGNAVEPQYNEYFIIIRYNEVNLKCRSPISAYNEYMLTMNIKCNEGIFLSNVTLLQRVATVRGT